MTFTQIRYFIEVADCLSFTEAANRLYVSQQAVSNQIRNLEKEIGVPLFSRTTKQVVLTDGGKMLYDEWKEMLRRSDESVETARRTYGRNRKKIRIGIAEVSGIIDVISRALASYSDAFPEVEFETEIRPFIKLEELLQKKAANVIVTLSSELSKYESAYQTHPLFELQLGIALPAKHPLGNKTDLSIADLREETIYMLSSTYSSEAEELIVAHCKAEGFTPKEIKFFHNIDSMEVALHTGKGVSVGYSIFFRNTDHQLKFYPIKGFIHQQLVAAWRKDSSNDLSYLFDYVVPQ
jgi:DNA-binding transcriptional LysR family regulator